MALPRAVNTGMPRSSQRVGKGNGCGDHFGGVGLPEVAPVEHGHGQRRGLGSIEIRGHPGEGNPVEPLGDIGAVGDDQATRRAAKALVGAHGHQVRAVLERVGPGTPGDHPTLVGSVAQHPRPDLVCDLPHRRDRVFVQVQAPAQRNQRRLFR